MVAFGKCDLFSSLKGAGVIDPTDSEDQSVPKVPLAGVALVVTQYIMKYLTFTCAYNLRFARLSFKLTNVTGVWVGQL